MTPTLQRGGQPRWPLDTLILLTALGVLAFCAGFKKIRAPDYWWHLSTGNWIAETGRVPTADVFTYTVPGAPWVEIHWLFQLGLAALHRLGGHDGIVLAKAALAVGLAAILVTVGWRSGRPWVAAFGVGTMLIIANERFLARPDLASFVFLAVILALLERNERKHDWWVAAVVPVQLVWVNMHGLFALGTALCGFYLVSEALRERRSGGCFRPTARLATITAIVVLASLANPNFVEGALYPFEQLEMIGPAGDRSIAGRNATEFRPVWHPLFEKRRLVEPALLGLLCLLSIAANWRRSTSRVAHALAFAAFGMLALQANRNLAIFAIVAAPLFARNANEWLDRHPPSAAVGRWATVIVAVLLVAASVDLFRGSFYRRMNTFHEAGLGTVDVFIPEGAVDWIERERPPGPIAHQMSSGGYLNWRLYPDYEVMIDGRLEVFGTEMLESLYLTTPRRFRRLDARYHFGSVLLSPMFDPVRFIHWMYRNPEWRLVYADMAGVLFVRPGADGSPQWPAVDVSAPDLLPEFEVGVGGMDRARLRARIMLLKGLGQPGRARVEREKSESH